MPQTPLLQLRLRQLRDLAAAFEVEILPNGTKTQILPALVAAEQTGIFQTVPKDAHMLRRAGWCSDDGTIPPEWGVEEIAAKEKKAVGILNQKNPTIQANTDGWTKLRADVKEKMGDDFKIWGKNKAELERIMADDD